MKEVSDTLASTAGAVQSQTRLSRYKVDSLSPSGVSNTEGKHLGYQRKDGYWILSYGGVHQLAHRVVYELTHGSIPEGMVIDHIDQDPSNNNPSNLRCVTQAENLRNVGVRSHSKSGVKNITFNASGTFSVRVRRKTVGTFDTLDAAIAARDKYEGI